MKNEDWTNLAMDRRINWDKDKYCQSNSLEELESWQNALHELSMLRCNWLTKPLHSVSTEVRKLPCYDGLGHENIFLDHFERDVPQERWFQVIEIALIATPLIWWGMHRDNFADWKEYHRMM